GRFASGITSSIRRTSTSRNRMRFEEEYGALIPVVFLLVLLIVLVLVILAADSRAGLRVRLGGRVRVGVGVGVGAGVGMGVGGALHALGCSGPREYSRVEFRLIRPKSI